MDTVLQVIAGVCYLCNKIFLSWMERTEEWDTQTKRSWHIAAWTIYLCGLPAWVFIFIEEHNWIAAAVETGGAPAMLLGLIVAIRNIEKEPPKWVDWTAITLCCILGFGASFYEFGVLITLEQWLETGLALGFLIGTYQLAWKRPSGYAWYVLMHLCCAALMLIQGYPALFLQQVVSLGFIADAWHMSHKRQTTQPTE